MYNINVALFKAKGLLKYCLCLHVNSLYTSKGIDIAIIAIDVGLSTNKLTTVFKMYVQ